MRTHCDAGGALHNIVYCIFTARSIWRDAALAMVRNRSGEEGQDCACESKGRAKA